MEAKVFAKPQYELTLTQDEANCLIESARHHYDVTCKNAVKTGGFLNFLNYELNCEKESSEYHVSVDFRKLDLMSKITEDFMSNVDPVKRNLYENIRQLVIATNQAPEFKDYIISVSFLHKDAKSNVR